MPILTEITQEKWEMEPMWSVVLSNSQRCYQNDYKDKEVWNSWHLLKYYADNNNLSVIEMTISFRDNRISLPKNQDGYFFRHGVLGSLNDSKYEAHFLVGFVLDSQLIVKRYQVPGMILRDSENRNPNEYESCIIWKKKNINLNPVAS